MIFNSIYTIVTILADADAQCHKTVLGLPPWHEKLNHKVVEVGGLQTCEIVDFELFQIWSIVASLTEGVIRIAAVVAVGMIIWGGFRFITSQGSPDTVDSARKTITGAIIGLIIAISAQAIIAIVEGLF